MKLSLKKIQQLNSKEIFELTLPTINDVYKSFDYMGLSEQDYYDLVLQEITSSKNLYNGDLPYEKFLEKRIGTVLTENLKKLLSQADSSIEIINNFLNKKAGKITNYKDSLKCFEKLDAFFGKYAIIPTPDLLLEIIGKNESFLKMIDLVLDKYYTQITSGNVERLFDNGTLITIIETYCMSKNIEIKEPEELESQDYEDENYEMTDSVRNYLREISKRPLLTVSQERELAQRVAAGDTRARNIFIESNLKLVVSVATKYMGR